MSSIAPRRLCRAGARSLYLVLLAIASLCDGSTVSVPADFSVGGCLFPGSRADYKASKPWRLRITREGKAIQEISIIGAGAGVRRTSKSFVLSEEDMRGLAAVVEQANFFGLPNKISNSEFDHFAGCVLKITMAG